MPPESTRPPPICWPSWEAYYEWRIQGLQDAVNRFRDETLDLRRTFALQWSAQMRAIKAWQADNPGNDLVWPDHAKLVGWLLDEMTDARGLVCEMDAELKALHAKLNTPETADFLEGVSPTRSGVIRINEED